MTPSFRSSMLSVNQMMLHTYRGNAPPNKKTICKNITEQWNALKDIIRTSDDKVTVPFTEFQKRIVYDTQGKEVVNKKGEVVKKLTPIKMSATATYLMEFVEQLLPTIVHHRNKLKLYRSSIKAFYQLFDAVHIDIDFSDRNLDSGCQMGAAIATLVETKNHCTLWDSEVQWGKSVPPIYQ